jgi:nitrogenase-stabilizing/protective protein
VPTTDLAAQLAQCRDAEDYFAALGVEFDPRVLDVGRLHVMRLFGRELEEIGGADPEQLRAALTRSYQALVTGGPLDHRVFKVLSDRAPGQFVPLAEVGIEGGDDE